MPSKVVPVADSPRWEPNAPEAVLATNGFGCAVLACRPHFDDPDRRTLVIVWSGVTSASMGGPNDEGRSEHRLYESGLDKLLWMGEVVGAAGVRRHFVVGLKEGVAEVVANSFSVERVDCGTAEAASHALTG